MSQIKISIIEFDYHAEVLRDFCRITENTDFLVRIFTTEKIWSAVGNYQEKLPANFQLFQKTKGKSLSRFIYCNYKELNSSDVIIFNTIASNFRLFSRLKLDPVLVVRIHNANAYFNKLLKTYKPIFTPFFVCKDLSHFLRKTIGELDWYYRKKFLHKVHYFAFPSKLILQHAIDTFHIQKTKAVYLPLSYTSTEMKKTKTLENTNTTVIVTGRVDRRVRDYMILYKSFKLALSKNNKPIRLVLLGKSNSVYGKKIVKLFKALESDKFSFISFPNYIEQDLFKNYIDNSDFLILPIKIDARYTIYNEKYGYTKMSGSINDLIKYQKPGLINAEYPLDDDLKFITEPYKDEKELADKIIAWSESEKYKSINFKDALKNYQLSKIQAYFKKTIKSML